MTDECNSTDISTDLEGDKVWHWFCFSYKGKSIDSGEPCDAYVYVGRQGRNISKKAITENKVNAGVSGDAVLIAVSYLGEMTREEFVRE